MCILIYNPSRHEKVKEIRYIGVHIGVQKGVSVGHIGKSISTTNLTINCKIKTCICGHSGASI